MAPKKSALHRTISAIRAETWEAINRALLTSARRPTPWSAISCGAIIGARRRSGRARSNMPAIEANGSRTIGS
jgi:hypothetical protein